MTFIKSRRDFCKKAGCFRAAAGPLCEPRLRMGNAALAGAAGDAADGSTHRLVGRLGHRYLEDAHEDVGAEGAGAVEGLADFGPVLLRATGAVEGLPDLF